jgi:mRNA interferase RelE/StbE
MTNELIFADQALKSLGKLPKPNQRRIITKLEWLSGQDLPGSWLKRLVNFELAQYRYRIGDFRVLCDFDANTKKLIVLELGHRKDIYDR